VDGDDLIKQTPVKVYFCPSRRKPVVRPLANGAMNDYVGNGGTNTGATNGAIIAMTGGTVGGINVVTGGLAITLGNISDGTSNTLLIGEKHMNLNNYGNGSSGNDNQGYWRGVDSDICGLAMTPTFTATGAPQFWQPLQDDPVDRNSGSGSTFGSAHPGGFQAAMCDGSVRMVHYAVNVTAVLMPACQRNDSTPFSLDNL